MVEKDFAVVEKDFDFGYPINGMECPIGNHVQDRALVPSNLGVGLHLLDGEILDIGSSSKTKGHRNISNSLSNLPQETSDRGLSSLEVEFKGINSFSKINFPALNDMEVGKLADLLIEQTVVMDGFNSFADTRIGVALLRMGGLVDLWIDRIEFDMVDLGTVSMHYLYNSSAHNLFEEMTKRTTTIYSKGFVFYPGGWDCNGYGLRVVRILTLKIGWNKQEPRRHIRTQFKVKMVLYIRCHIGTIGRLSYYSK